MFVRVLLLLGIVHFTNAGVWVHVGHACIGAKGNGYIEMAYNGSSSFVAAVKLVHTEGYVSNKASNTGSHWGANDGTALATLITDDRNRILYPSPRGPTVSANGWYVMPGYTGISPELVFSDFCVPQYFDKGRKLRVWYGEDLNDSTENDNHGISCMDVCFYLIGC